MAKLMLAVALAGTGVFFWHYPVIVSRGVESVSLATVLWVSALLLFMSFLIESSTRGP
jgi:hypothetical protein